MVCPNCGIPVSPGVRFCSRCGAHLAYAAPPPAPAAYYTPVVAPRPRVARNLQTAGILWCVYGAYRVVAALIGIVMLRAFTMHSFGGPGWPFPHGFGPDFGGGFLPMWMGAFLPLFALLTVVSTALAFFVGYSLLQRKPWGRTLAIVAAILALFKPLLGTALGIYTLWLLAPEASGVEYDALADRT
jgi:zinc-ribbon domain